MGIFYLGFTREDTGADLRQEAAILDADIERIAVAYGSIYFPNGVEVPDTDPPQYRQPTGAEIFDAMSVGLLNGILDNTLRVERIEAAKSEAEKVPPISVAVKQSKSTAPQ